METILTCKDRIRVKSSSSISSQVFVDLDSLPEICPIGLAIDFYPSQRLSKGESFQIRIKEGYIRVFHFEKPEYLAEYDFGYWSDSEILYSNAPQSKAEEKPANA